MELPFRASATEASVRPSDSGWYVAIIDRDTTELAFISRDEVGDVILDVNLSNEESVIGCIEQFVRKAGYQPTRCDDVAPPEIAAWTLTPLSDLHQRG